MKKVNLLEFLNTAEDLPTLDCHTLNDNLINLLDLFKDDDLYMQKLSLGIIYVSETGLNRYKIIDGVNRILSISLLLHAICECYKKTSHKNDKAINTIRSKYLLKNDKLKLKLSGRKQEIYYKILFAEKLSGHEKESQIFVLLHSLWQEIKNKKLQAANIFRMLNKIEVYLVDIDDIPARDFYYEINKNNRDIDQVLLLKDLYISYKEEKSWQSLSNLFDNKESDIEQFFKNYFALKMDYKLYKPERLYNIVKNYINTMLKYKKINDVCEEILFSANLYRNILYINFEDEYIRSLMIKIKLHKGEDTLAYLLSIYEDYSNGRFTKEIFTDILSTIDEYLVNRLNKTNTLSFNDLINYLNAFIACK